MTLSAHPVEICVPLPLEHPLTYLWPERLGGPPHVGQRVLVPLGRRNVAGYVVAPRAKAKADAGSHSELVLKEVLERLDEEPLFGPRELAFYQWISRYYLSPLGEVLRTALPSSFHVRSYEALRILPLGLWALKKESFLTRQEHRILQTLRRSGKTPLKTLRKTTPDFSMRWVRSLESKGFAEFCQVFRGRQKPLEAQDSFVWFSPELDGPSAEDLLGLLDPEEARLCRRLLAHGPCPRSEVEKDNPGAAKHLSSLLEQGFLRAGSLPFGAIGPHGFVASEEFKPKLTREQERAVRQILQRQARPGFEAFLLHGVTGSGKTEVYLRVIERTLQAGRDALVLVPEIGLTPQTVARFASRFRTQLAVLHSGLAESERLDFWWKIRKGQIKIAIGARSAVFAPFQNLGVVVVDEEHDPSYKQQDRVRYNGRDLALVRGKLEHALVILGSATPSLESYYNALCGKSILIELRERVEKRPSPEIQLVDLKDRAVRRSPGSSLSLPLERALARTLAEGKKSLLFLNRRGYAQTVVCRDCGHLFRCPRCSVTLTYHLDRRALSCHYCEFDKQVPDRCPQCATGRIRPLGHGTEKVEEEIQHLFPDARIGRMDRDSTRRKGSHEEILRRFRSEELDILVGTQMIAKGHDVPEVTLVGVILADVSLDLPDFRASERTFQLLLQVAGRAGRGPWPGHVVVQTRHPDHFCLKALLAQDHRMFFEQELAFRKALSYPPFCRMVNIRVSGPDQETTREAAAQVGSLARSMPPNQAWASQPVEVLGPSQAPLSRLRGRFRYHLFLKSSDARGLIEFTRELVCRARPVFSARNVGLEVDVDPVQVL